MNDMEKIYLLQLLNILATAINTFELLVMLAFGYIDRKNEWELNRTIWDTNEDYEDVLDTRDYSGSALVIPQLLCEHYGQSHGTISLINNPMWNMSTIGHINPQDGTYPKYSTVQLITRFSRREIMLMSDKLCGDAWAPLVISLATGLTSATIGLATYNYAYSEALLRGIAAVTLGPTVVGCVACMYYTVKAVLQLHKTFDMHDVARMRKRSGNTSLKRMMLVKEKTTLQIVTTRSIIGRFPAAMNLDNLLDTIPSKISNKASKRAHDMIRAANVMKKKIKSGEPRIGYDRVSFFKLDKILEGIREEDYKQRLCEKVYNAAISRLKQNRQSDYDKYYLPVTRLEDERVMCKIVEQAIEKEKVIGVYLFSSFFDLQSVREGYRRDWTAAGETKGWL